MAESYADQLERVQTTIAAIEERGQSYSIGSRSLTRADLPDLYEREKYLRRMVARTAGGRSGGIRSKLGTPV